MKLKNKLLPFVGIAALGATFAPIALTSCGSKSSSNAIDLREWYTPTIEKHAYATMTSDEAASLYFCGDETAEWGDWLDEDEMNERLTQDYLFGSSMWVQYLNENSLSVSNAVLNTVNNLAPAAAEQTYFDLLGINGVVGMKEKTDAQKSKDAELTSSVTYNKYNVVVSDVRINHATNYYTYETGEEVPTISFQLEFDIEATVRSNGLYNSGNELHLLTTDNLPAYIEGEVEAIESRVQSLNTTSTQNHKGSLTVVNVPIKLAYSYIDELGTKAWSLGFDAQTLYEAELSTRIPFAIYGTDNITYSSASNIDGRSNSSSGTRVNDFDYYSNMLWEKLLTSQQIWTAGDKYREEYEKQRAAGKTHEEASELALEARTEYVIETGVTQTLNYLNADFFGTASYYLLSVECKD